jgi:hypothetical protein
MALKNYDPKLITVNFGGLLLSGFADGELVKVERSEDTFSMSVGAHGDTTRVRNRNRNGMVSVRLQAEAADNDRLSAILALDELRGNGTRTMTVKNLNGTTIASAPTAWIRKPPETGYAKEASVREWIFDCYNLTLFVGGAVV